MDDNHRPSKQERGAFGESVAEDFLLKKGYELVERNFDTRWGEIDLIVKDRDCLVFVEVKYRTSFSHGDPEEALTPQKIRHMVKAAMMYLQLHRLRDISLRFDVLTIAPDGLRHYESAFDPPNQYYF